MAKENCFGCWACVQICPTKCIEAIPDEEGFSYPVVEESFCTDCDACVKVCPAENESIRTDQFKPPVCKGVLNINENIRFQSSSGGVFTTLAEHTFEKGGVVFGAVYDYENPSVFHRSISSMEDISLMQKSKYVQSDIRETYLEVRRSLRKKIPVVFTGTPCQVDGLYQYLGKNRSGLITCDIICHGVPSPQVFNDYFSGIRSEIKSPIRYIDFRGKKYGWGSWIQFMMHVKTTKKEILKHSLLSIYYTLFLSNTILRPVCYQCPYSNTRRISDLTMGDYWGVQKYKPELHDGKGTTLLLINTEKGIKTFQEISTNFIYESCDLSKSLQHNLIQPTKEPSLRNPVIKVYSKL
ncbi:MAG: Coenzyme F420 hydrogenase/dehydrogenase, beta subunit C-terminal domain, partial [Candidatus Helarchaeota archaeon]